MHIYWHYYKTIFFINIFLSAALVLMLGSVKAYAGLFATLGYLLSMGLLRFFESNTVYLYFNLGYSRLRLQVVSFFLNLAVANIFYLLITWLARVYGNDFLL